MNDQWMLCWNQRRNELEIVPVGKALADNRNAYADDSEPLAVSPLYIGPLADVEAARELCRPTLAKRAAEPAVHELMQRFSA
jgi:hypothetical protein